MIAPVLQWWAQRSLRLRITALATAVLTVGLVVGTVALAGLFFRARVSATDRVLGAEMAAITQLLASGDLPSPLPAPAAGATLAQIVDHAGTVLGATATVSSVLPMLTLDQLDPHADHTFTTSASTLGPSSLRVALQGATLRGVPVTVIVATPFTDVASTITSLRHVLFIVVPLVLLAAAAATWLAVGSALQPVEDLRAAADAVDVGAGRRAPELAVPTGSDELRRLGDTLNRMLRRLHNAGEQQRAFITDAAHELRSPIASVQTQLEVAIATDTEVADWPAIAGDVLADVQRLSRLADDLLLLARLDANPARPSTPVDVGRMADPAGPSMFVDGDSTELERLLANLVANARRHSAHQVEVQATRAGDQVVVTVDDDGPGIAVDDRERVFDRWVRLDSGRSRDSGGSGLGLPIARSIARVHGGDITLGESELGGLRAIVRLPGSDRTRRLPDHQASGQ